MKPLYSFIFEMSDNFDEIEQVKDEFCHLRTVIDIKGSLPTRVVTSLDFIRHSDSPTSLLACVEKLPQGQRILELADKSAQVRMREMKHLCELDELGCPSCYILSQFLCV